MLDGSAVIYEYDGSLAGLLTCVFQIYQTRRQPMEIQPEDQPQEWLYGVERVESNPEQARRVYDGVGRRMGPQARDWVETAFCSGDPGKEMAIYRFIRLGMKTGPQVVRLLGHPQVAPLWAMVRGVGQEAHQLTGFLRFSDLGGLLAAEIHPHHFVLPRLEAHFSRRFPQERFIIYDATHQAVAAYEPYQSRLFFVRDFSIPHSADQVAQLWKGYFRAASIQARLNPLCQRTHCPKRFWRDMLEMEGGPLLFPHWSQEPLPEERPIDKPFPESYNKETRVALE